MNLRAHPLRLAICGVGATLVLAGGYLWATRGAVVLLDLSWTGCF
ncbi:MAG: hypothetical protein U1F33_16805 [Alphaproteobacteria bacterium]